MSELIHTRKSRYRRTLLTTTSAMVLMAQSALAENVDRPILWIEGGWHMENVSGGQQLFDPAYMNTIAQAGLASPLSVQNLLSYGSGAEGGLSFQPEDSDWIFSASFRYGRAGGHKKIHQEKAIPVTYFTFEHFNLHKTAYNDYADIQIGNKANHLIADFHAGKDVGLGLFGHGSTSTFGFGVRFAQFTEDASNMTRARPDNHFVTGSFFGKYFPFQNYHNYTARVQRVRSFSGLGPAISWSNSTPLIGTDGGGHIALDWGANAALLFGRQKAEVHSQSAADHRFWSNAIPNYTDVLTHHVGGGTRHRNVIVPNLGGFAGLSLDWTNAKISMGYRADFFFGAIDGGLDTRKDVNRGFYGPFANVSIGIGG